MKTLKYLTVKKLKIFFVIYIIFILRLNAQDTIQNVLYFSLEENSVLSPGAELLKNGVLITNQNISSDVSFQLSTDTTNWQGFALASRMSGIYAKKEHKFFYFKILTKMKDETIFENKFKVNFNSCYSIFWNYKKTIWDLKKNRCNRVLQNY